MLDGDGHLHAEPSSSGSGRRFGTIMAATAVCAAPAIASCPARVLSLLLVFLLQAEEAGDPAEESHGRWEVGDVALLPPESRRFDREYCAAPRGITVETQASK